MPFFLKIANAFKIHYSVMFDSDSDRGGSGAKSKLVTDSIDAALCIDVEILDPRLENELGIATDGHKLRPTSIIRVFEKYGPDQIPPKLKTILEKTLS
jgi:hypothetical protein